MTLDAIKALVVSADPDARHYDSAHRKGEAYTTWREVRLLPWTTDDGHEEAWAFQVDRFTKAEADAIAAAIRAALEAEPAVAYIYEVDYEPDTGYIHHIFDCEGY